MTRLYHYTDAAGNDAITKTGYVVPVRKLLYRKESLELMEQMPAWTQQLFDMAWFTDLEVPHREALGLTMLSLRTDRTQYRFTVADAHTVYPWSTYRRKVNPTLRTWLEQAPGALPMHWYVSIHNVKVET